MTAANETLRNSLLADASLVAAVGQRVRFDLGLEADTYPLLILRQVADIPYRGIDGSLHARQETFQVESWGLTRSDSAAVHRLVEAALANAGLAPTAADPDALDPDTAARACVWNVDIWS